ncbi:MAG: outer membrane beta-barrel protein [Planctomycetia bacterium]
MCRGCFIRCSVALIAAVFLVPPGSARADGLSGVSAYGTASGLGASATTGIPFGPSQRSRRLPLEPRELPPAPSSAIPAAGPPRDPVFEASLYGGQPLVAPIAMTAQEQPAAPPQPSLPPTATPLAGPAFAGVPPAAASLPPLPAPAASASAPGYGSPSLGYGPPVSYAPRPPITTETVRLPATAPPMSAPASSAPSFGAGNMAPFTDPPFTPLPSPTTSSVDERMPSWDDLPEGPDRRFYLASILGADFGTLSVGNGPNATDPLFTTGGAVGIALERPQGWIRTEFEARYRDPVSSTVGDPTLGGSASVTARDGWSTMINAWRDLEITDRVALYLGGGIGGGGYTVAFNGGFPALGVGLSGSTAVTGFAWQAGGGASWLLTERVALDLGYRWYAVDGGPATIDATTPFFSFSDSIGTNFGASELLFSLRVYEPFRRWGP